MARERYDIRGKTIFITGAARGIGADSARRLAARGARLALAGLEPDLLERLSSELPDSAWFECDVTDWDGLRSAVDGAVEHFGGIDVVIANAGISTVGTVESLDPAAFERVIEVNLLGVWRTIRTALPHVIERRGYVLPVASLAAAMHAPLMANYAAAKAGVEAFGNSLRMEMRPYGVKVGVAYFGFIDTDMVRDSFADPAAALMRRQMPGPVGKPVPLHHASRAIVRGVERRARRVYAPRWILPMLMASGIFQHASERGSEDHLRNAIETANKLALEGASTRTEARLETSSAS